MFSLAVLIGRGLVLFIGSSLHCSVLRVHKSQTVSFDTVFFMSFVKSIFMFFDIFPTCLFFELIITASELGFSRE